MDKTLIERIEDTRKAIAEHNVAAAKQYCDLKQQRGEVVHVLRAMGMSLHAIAIASGISKASVTRWSARAKQDSWPTPPPLESREERRSRRQAAIVELQSLRDKHLGIADDVYATYERLLYERSAAVRKACRAGYRHKDIAQALDVSVDRVEIWLSGKTGK